MNEKNKLVYIILCFYLISCKNPGYDSIPVVKDVDCISENKTEIYSDKNLLYKIYPGSYVKIKKSVNDSFNPSKNIILNKGHLLVFNKKVIKKTKIKNINSDIKVFFNNIQGNCQFYRISLPYEFEISKSEAKIEYYLKDGSPRQITTKINLLFNDKVNNYYGFFIPFNLYWDIDNYKVILEISDLKTYYLKSIQTISVKSREYEKQTVYFKRSKSNILKKTDMAKYKEEKLQRDKIYSQNNKDVYFNSGYFYPVANLKYLTSDFGLRRDLRFYDGTLFFRNIHAGVDYADLRGTIVFAAGDGIIRYARNGELVGNAIIIDHGFSFYTEYYHLDKFLVNEGDFVRKGDPVAAIGSTGAATGPHLHWGVRVNEMIVDPRSLLDIMEIFLK